MSDNNIKENQKIYEEENKEIFLKNENILKNENKIKKRLYILDNIKGIQIFLVVFAHFLYEYANSEVKSLSNKIVNYIYCFHMPVFVFLSGFLSKSVNSRSFKSIAKLLLIYIIFNFTHGLILFYYNKYKMRFNSVNHSYWYLLCLIYWRFSVNYFSNQFFSIFISLIVSILVGFNDRISNVFSLKRTFSFFPYFIIGYKLSKEHLEKMISLSKRFYLFYSTILLFLLYIYESLKILPFIKVKHSMMCNNYENYKEDIKIRIILFINSFLIIIFSIIIFPNKKIFLLSKFGKNSLYIYLFHRFITIVISNEFFNKTKYTNYIVEYSLIFSIIILLTFGSDFFGKVISESINFIYDNLSKFNLKGKIIHFILSIFLIYTMIVDSKLSHKVNFKKSNINPTFYMQSNIRGNFIPTKLINSDDFQDSIRISYVGDLILLKDQVISAKNKSTGKYEFDEMFKYPSYHFKKSDLTIGVYEGPSAGNNTNYSTSNYGDGIPLYFNYPDDFAESVKKAGIDFVTTSNNHLMDKGIEGALRTIDILKRYNITHIGSYKINEKKNLVVVNVKGIKFAFLSYTSFVNNWNAEKLYEKYQYITNIIPFEKNKYYSEIYKSIENDFIKARNTNPDYIVVLAHMGTQFSLKTNKFQKKWNKIFSDLGADIILGDHTHSVQPLENLNKTFIVNCPGNFANSYIKHYGDATSIVNLYFNKITKKFIGSSVIPMYTQEYKPKYFRALPIFNIFNNSINISEIEMNRVEYLQKFITKIMLGVEINITNIKENYYFINGSYIDIDNKESKIRDIIEKNKNKELFKLIDNSYSITFIGDSITEGTKNNLHPWYEPLVYYFKNKKIINISKGSYTTELIIRNYKNLINESNSDLYIIALGTNDVRYRNEKIFAMTKERYIQNIETIIRFAKGNNHISKFVLIAPWLSDKNDAVSRLNEYQKNKLLKEYSESLNEFSNKNDYLFINPNNYIFKKIQNNITKYLLDHINPNEKDGIELYSEAVINSSP
jgi:fucose 4-O-acetylase-like acetyltransferase/poly-gamma-glutamate capsule biosynthesis protein CapA/YwtB (metallophosphatase superfamily)/lysophospholipase L1-like esterase